VVAYARDHHVTIVPEIDMPGHATAMVAAYPELASIASPPRTPSHDWGILPNLLAPSPIIRSANTGSGTSSSGVSQPAKGA
jgi:hexosaminidase